MSCFEFATALLGQTLSLRLSLIDSVIQMRLLKSSSPKVFLFSSFAQLMSLIYPLLGTLLDHVCC